ncbi:NAD(P)H-dependent flavin oxidoreductase [Bacillus mycoides]|uniref:NAD(P)H-dependent flavin oxidoreductase n=1 Tax=Bacillus mycoides TaxID=1405 RepID=UPI003D027832
MHNELCELLDIDHPIIQAGMAGGSTTVDLVVSVSEAGGLGSLGAAYMSPKEIRLAIREIRSITDKPFAVNLFCTELKDNLDRVEQVQEVLNKMRNNLGLKAGIANISTKNLFKEQFHVLIEERVPVISTAFGSLPTEQLQIAKDLGIKVITMVTTVREAQLVEEHGVDVIVAQGSEAGGHRGTFHVEPDSNGANIGLFSLIPQVVDAVSIPVVAAGGIMDERGLVAALALGAKGIQMGTIFLPTAESGAHDSYKEALLQSNEESTVLTKSFSGRPARGIKNKFIEEFENSGITPLAFPTQNTVTGDIRKEASKQNNVNFMSLWAGQGTRLLNKKLSAQEIIKQTINKSSHIIEHICKIKV